MNAATIGKRSSCKSFFIWIYNHKIEAYLILWFIAFAAIFFNYMMPEIRIQPTILNPQTTNEVFMPAGTEVVTDVKNIMQGWGKSIALMQIERKDMETFKLLASESSKHYMVIKKDLDGDGNSNSSKILLEYYSKNPSDTHVFHISNTINPPSTYLYFYTYDISDFQRVGNKIIANYKSALNGGYVMLSIIICMGISFFIAFIPDFILYVFSKRVYKKCFER